MTRQWEMTTMTAAAHYHSLRNNAGMRHNYSVCTVTREHLAIGYGHDTDALDTAKMYAKKIGRPVRLFLDDGCPSMIVAPK